MTSQLLLSEAPTSLASAYTLLLERGYAVTNVASDEGIHILVRAEKDGLCFLGENPLTLLGLIHLHEVLGEDWPPTSDQRAVFVKFFYSEPFAPTLRSPALGPPTLGLP